MIRVIYYNWRNLWYYRQERKIGHHHLMDIVIPDGDTQRAMADAFLATVGLKIVDDKKDAIPWYILLSPIQRNWIRKVSEYGYKVGLT